MENGRSRVLGMGLIVASTAFFGLAGVFTKATAQDAWTIAGWRGLVGSILIAAYVLWRRRSELEDVPLRLGWRGWSLAVVGSLTSLLFIASFKFTYVANVAMIYATVPFMAAVLEWLALGEKVQVRTMTAAAVSLAGVAVIVGGGVGSGHLVGDALAVLMAAGCALYMVMIRAFRGTPVVWAGAIAALLLFGASWFVADPLAVSARDLLVISGFGISFAAAVILWTEGTKLLPAAEAGLLGTAEVPFAVFFAWLILAELPPGASILGGSIVLGTVLLHAGRDLAVSYGKARSEAAE